MSVFSSTVTDSQDIALNLDSVCEAEVNLKDVYKKNMQDSVVGLSPAFLPHEFMDVSTIDSAIVLCNVNLEEQYPADELFVVDMVHDTGHFLQNNPEATFGNFSKEIIGGLRKV